MFEMSFLFFWYKKFTFSEQKKKKHKKSANIICPFSSLFFFEKKTESLITEPESCCQAQVFGIREARNRFLQCYFFLFRTTRSVRQANKTSEQNKTREKKRGKSDRILKQQKTNKWQNRKRENIFLDSQNGCSPAAHSKRTQTHTPGLDWGVVVYLLHWPISWGVKAYTNCAIYHPFFIKFVWFYRFFSCGFDDQMCAILDTGVTF